MSPSHFYRIIRLVNRNKISINVNKPRANIDQGGMSRESDDDNEYKDPVKKVGSKINSLILDVCEDVLKGGR